MISVFKLISLILEGYEWIYNYKCGNNS